MSRRRQKRIAALLVALLSLALAYLTPRGYVTPVAKIAEQNQPGLYTVLAFNDGDTITVDMNGSEEKVRFIGVDTPETQDPRKSVQCFGKAASNFTKNLIGTNKVRLEADPENTNRDRYNRLLRYVYLPDGRLVNREIIVEGYGFAYTFFPFSKIEEFKQLQSEAQAGNRGLWGNCSIETSPTGQTSTQAI